jgi:hypothetical protein
MIARIAFLAFLAVVLAAGEALAKGPAGAGAGSGGASAGAPTSGVSPGSGRGTATSTPGSTHRADVATDNLSGTPGQANPPSAVTPGQGKVGTVPTSPRR